MISMCLPTTLNTSKTPTALANQKIRKGGPAFGQVENAFLESSADSVVRFAATDPRIHHPGLEFIK